MALAAPQARLLALTARKHTCEDGISYNSMAKMSLTRQQSDLTREYYSKLQNKNVAYYANGKYNKINYGYLMGYGIDFTPITAGSLPLKGTNSMILSDCNGRVVLNSSYAKAIQSVIGTSATDSSGRGGTFSTSKIPQILTALFPQFSEQEIQNAIQGEITNKTCNGNNRNQMTGENTGSTDVDYSEYYSEEVGKIVQFYYPIFAAAAANGWTTEYEQDMKANPDYVSDAINSGAFQLANVDTSGNYDPDTSLTYFITAGLLDTNLSSDIREEITAWYDAEKRQIAEKESWINMEIQDLSTELEAINTEMKSLESFIKDAISSVFDWGSG